MRKATYIEIQELGIQRGGKLISKEYLGGHIKHSWECNKGHSFEARPTSVRRGHWCPECVKFVNRIPSTINKMKSIAKERGGICISEEYLNNHSKLNWKCINGHNWSASAKSIIRGSWCPYCYLKPGENICREIFQLLFETNFPCKRPVWLKSPAGMNLELDGFSEKLNIAFEYQGRQHTTLDTGFIKTEDELQNRIILDQTKRDICKQKGITLVEIEEVRKLFPITEFINKIYEACERSNLKIKNSVSNSYIIFNINWKHVYSPQNLNMIQELANEKGGKCLSNTFKGWFYKLEFECVHGHRWETTPMLIKTGKWCKICGYKKNGENKRGSIKEMHEIAKTRGGKCLSLNYIDSNTHLLWQCFNGHTWRSTPLSIKNSGSWCPHCLRNTEGRQKKLEDIAEIKGGKVIGKYIDAIKKVKFECSEKHQWEASPTYIINKSTWCPVCAREADSKNKSLGLNKIKEIAKQRGGVCLSQEYKNYYSRLQFKCEKGHNWVTQAQNILNNCWCPVCAKSRFKKLTT